jgi:hypothetical protein
MYVENGRNILGNAPGSDGKIQSLNYPRGYILKEVKGCGK